MTYAKLNGANLVNAELHAAVLNFAELNGADLYEAELNGAFLYEADLSRVNFEPAVLPSADLMVDARNLFEMRYENSPRALRILQRQTT